MDQDYYGRQQPPKQNGGQNRLLTAVAVLLILAIVGITMLTGAMVLKNAAGNVSAASQAEDNGISYFESQAAQSAPLENSVSAVEEASGTSVENRTEYRGDYELSTVDGNEALSVKEIAKAASGSVVEISTEKIVTGSFFSQYITEGAGSGVIIDSNGLIVTNNHVIEDATTITVRLTDGSTYSAELVGADAAEDLAVVRIDASGLVACKYGVSDGLEVGDPVVAIGNPLGTLGGTVTNGIISATDRQIKVDGNVMTLLQTNAALSPGNSGGGLFNESGELIGIVNAKSTGENVEGLGFAIPVSHAKGIIEDLVNFGYVRGKTELGASFIDIDNDNYLRYYGLSEYGTYIYSVTSGTDAAVAGLKSGDIVISINGKAIESKADIDKLLEGASVGTKLSFVIKRSGSQRTVEVTLTEYKPN